jgi:hypothetical protein
MPDTYIQDQILAVLGHYVGVVTDDSFKSSVTDELLLVDGVASVAIHFDPDVGGKVDASVEFHTGEVITFNIQPAAWRSDPIADLQTQIADLALLVANLQCQVNTVEAEAACSSAMAHAAIHSAAAARTAA